ncbi:HAD family hydrolase [Clostridium algoriphilum]|uniref:HAD family hydrolase n=1 Tax=Clostridium algoriphilum TaxID=198347 RepID=UPI001CF199AB|nr:HAD family hydrolase [Clostridium algoriphilum]MCB2293669.1 HAD family hydrolase [Clostridium algoriphilum]
MLKYKWCVCDMDGTLFNSSDVISKENETALKKLQQSGLEVIIASGRVDLMLKPFIKQLDLKGYVISCNGGLIRDIETGNILYSKVMDKISVRKIITYCIEYNIHFLIYTTDVVFSNKNNPRAAKFENLNKMLPNNLQVPIKYVDNKIIENIDDINAIKILLVCSDHEHVKSLEEHFSSFDDLTALSSMGGLLDIMASNISKGRALKILSEKLDVDLTKVIAFGDNYNDIDMFQRVGMPIAMGNSVEELKTYAKYITRSNDESGIAYAINNFIWS